MLYSFDQFLAGNGLYTQTFRSLAPLSPVLARSARTVVELHGDKELSFLAESILSWVRRHYGQDFLQRYLERLDVLDRLQARFTENPCLETLGDSTLKVDRGTYDTALLLSMVYSNHRFELLESLKSFLRILRPAAGRIACVGAGTGYELFVVTTLLPRWVVEGYECDIEARRNARGLLMHHAPERQIGILELFPLDCVEEDFRGRFDAIVMCELLEHLVNPLLALRTAREYLHSGGRMFVTMAINLAQEDHVFLYSDAASCRRQLVEAGLVIQREWLIPVIVHPLQNRRVSEVERGNYVAIVTRKETLFSSRLE